MGLTFSHPEYLLLLPVLWAFTWYISRISLADLDRSRRVLSNGLRFFLMTILVLALAGVQLVRPADRLCTVFIIDISDSVLPTQRAQVIAYLNKATSKMHARDTAALVAFGADALLELAPGSRENVTKINSILDATKSNIAAGIQLAIATFPPDAGKQIVILSDGNENRGNALDQAAALHGAQDVRISVVPLERDKTRGEALLMSANAPAEAHIGAPVQISVIAESLQEMDATIILERDGVRTQRRPVHLKAGKSVFVFDESVQKTGVCHFRALLEAPHAQDAIADNNIVEAYTRVAGKPTVLIVEGTPGEGATLARALQANDINIQLSSAAGIPRNLAESMQYDSLVFANVPAWKMSPLQMKSLSSAIHDSGLGFIMVGGEVSFGAGGYAHSALEEALPVDMTPKPRKDMPSITLVIVIDISGSMGAPEDGVPKYRIAAAAASAAVELLQPTDNVCVMGFDTRPTYTVPLTKADNQPRMHEQISRLTVGGGGITARTALEEAYKVIRGSSTKIKHIIFCADASDTEEHEGCLELAQRMKKEKITLSVVGFGNPGDPDVSFHRELASIFGSQAYLAQRVSNLPQIFTRDVLSVQDRLLVEEPFIPLYTGQMQPNISNIAWGSAPPLQGYVLTTLKEAPGAQQLLSSHKKDPIFATWMYGLGRSAAFTSDATTHWAAHWLSWPDYTRFWSQIVRWTIRKSNTSSFQTMLTEEKGRATIQVDAVNANGEYRNLLDFRAHIAHVPATGWFDETSRAVSETIPIPQTASGHYEASFATDDKGIYQVTVEERNGNDVTGMQNAILVIPYSPEYQSLSTNRQLLTKIAEETHGVVDPLATDIFNKYRFSTHTQQQLWPILTALLACLFLLDVAVRRILLPWQELAVHAESYISRHMPTRNPLRLTATRDEALIPVEVEQPVEAAETNTQQARKPAQTATASALLNLRKQARDGAPIVLERRENDRSEPPAPD